MKRFLLLLITIALAAPLFADPQPSPGEDPLAQFLFPPELLMAHQQELHLQDQQKATIKAEVGKAQARFFDLQWQMNEESGKLAALLAAPQLDEAKVLEQADKVMGLEREIKRTHLSLLIRLRNLLTPEQAAAMGAIRRSGK